MLNVERPIQSQTSIQGIQRFGRLLSRMIMPNISAFLAWGLLNALFLPSGWFPNEALSQLIQPMMIYLLPLLIGFTGGKLIYGHRGGVIGAVVTMGAIVGTSNPMFFGAMITGPFAGWMIKKFDSLINKRIPSGFEMLVHNFASGILGGVLAICAFLFIGPVVEFFGERAAELVAFAVNAGWAPVASIVIEPAKVLFLNNFVNHGVLSPLGYQQAAQNGVSLLFLLETNPGPGLGVLLAFFCFAKGAAKQSSPGAMLIHFLGGVHEVYFPYILMQPKLLFAVIGGGAAGVFTFSTLNAGLVAVPSPGSIMSIVAMAPKEGLFPVIAGIFVSTLVSFILSAILINRNVLNSEDSVIQADENIVTLQGEQVPNGQGIVGYDDIPVELDDLSKIKLIAVACDAGMGSSAMGAGKLIAAFTDAGIKTKVINCSIDELNASIDLVITNEKLTHRAINKSPEAAHIAVTDFITTRVYQALAEQICIEKAQHSSPIKNKIIDNSSALKKESILLGLKSVTQEEAIRLAGNVLYEGGYVEQSYIQGMVDREQKCSTYICNGAAIPHGTHKDKQNIKRTGISILQFPDGIDFNNNRVYLLVGIAALREEHLAILAKLAIVVEDESKMESIRKSDDKHFVLTQFSR